jgi:hypothetical protein
MAKIITKAVNKNNSNNGTMSIKHVKYVKKHKNLKKYLLASILVNIMSLSYLIYLTTIK